MHFTDTILFDINFVQTLEDLMEIKTRTRSEVEEYTVKMHRNKGKFAIIFQISWSRFNILDVTYTVPVIFGLFVLKLFQNELFGLFGVRPVTEFNLTLFHRKCNKLVQRFQFDRTK